MSYSKVRKLDLIMETLYQRIDKVVEDTIYKYDIVYDEKFKDHLEIFCDYCAADSVNLSTFQVYSESLVVKFGGRTITIDENGIVRRPGTGRRRKD